MKILVLGAAAGGGFPQWNSNAPACRRARARDPAASPRTQASLAVSDSGNSWMLLNASPDLRQQIEATPALQPQRGLRSSPIASVVLTGADVDAIAGLLSLRERQALTIYATAAVLAVLDANPIFEVLARDTVRRAPLILDRPEILLNPDGSNMGLTVTAFAVPGKLPLYLEGPDRDPEITIGEETVGLEIRSSGAAFFSLPSCAAMTADLARRLRGAELVFFDGTLWADDEMIRAGIGRKTGRRMGHMSLSGSGGTLEAFAELEVRRKVLLHINNSNPVLLDDSPENAAVRAAGWEVSYDGMEIAL